MLKQRIKYLFLAAALVVTQIAVSQKSDLGIWSAYFGNQQIKNKWLLQSDFQYRLNQFADQKSQLLLRAGIGYNLTGNNHNILMGLAFVDSRQETEGARIIEKRIYQQFLYKKKYNQIFTTHRVRLEERFFPNEFGLRSRYFFAVQLPFTKNQLNKRGIYASSFNELFIDVRNKKFDRNRMYGGLGYVLSNVIRLETGFLIQSYKNNTRGQFQLSIHNNLSL